MSVHSFFSRQKGVGFIQSVTLSPGVRETAMPSGQKSNWGSLRTKIFFAMCMLGFSGFFSGVICSMVFVNPAYLVLSLVGSITLVVACIILRLTSFFQREAFDIIRIPGSLFSFLRSKTHFFGPFSEETFHKELRNKFVVEERSEDVGRWKPIKKNSRVSFLMGKESRLREMFLGSFSIEVCGISSELMAEVAGRKVFRGKGDIPDWFLSQINALDKLNSVGIISEPVGKFGLASDLDDVSDEENIKSQSETLFKPLEIVVGRFFAGGRYTEEELQVAFFPLSKMFLGMLKEGVSLGKSSFKDAKEIVLNVTIPDLFVESEASSQHWLLMLAMLDAVETLNNEVNISEGRSSNACLEQITVSLSLGDDPDGRRSSASSTSLA
ncbi:hypothetical protein [Chlamydiifrater volucris]|uniref:hypothetical protein n=1 Tax=Chlamydiifrater volucris TaxID=2681470 RepID=UPI001BD02699|nr:hypothetical protein [Chlamydiifrater volucris]